MPGVWVDVSSAVTLSGDRNVVNEPAGQAARFYRLGLRNQVPSAAALEIGRDGSNLLISWPVSAGNYALESATSFAGPWFEVSATPSVVNGWNIISQARDQPQRFYRLLRR
jgi:hypothetical protein